MKVGTRPLLSMIEEKIFRVDVSERTALEGSGLNMAEE